MQIKFTEEYYMSETALLIIDMQKGMMQKDVFNKQNLIGNINSLLDFFHANKNAVFLSRHTNDSYSKQNSEAWQLIDELRIMETNTIINKSHSSIFKDGNYAKILKNLNIDKLVITGLVTNGCVQTACLDAKKLGFHVTLISDAHSTFHMDAPQVIDKWNAKLADEGITLLSTAEFLDM
jgi:nicotinamidase-related amidase